jgi:hypothetical protein
LQQHSSQPTNWQSLKGDHPFLFKQVQITMLSPAANVHLRSPLVAQEPLKVRSPIYGFFRGLPPPDQGSSLSDALAPLIEASHGSRHATCHVASPQQWRGRVTVKQFQEAGSPSRLTVSGIAAINLYTGEFAPPQFYSV